MDISLVTGTYNRLPSLQRMAESARASVQGILGLSLDFILVDGGSGDGTQEWCKIQPDVVLIAQAPPNTPANQLTGAVKAFNTGAFAAIGTYIILANDDIEFVSDSILLAYQYMQDNPDCGIGCFYQDRERQHLPDSDPGKWYVAEMPCVDGGRQVWRPYGQVCIVPKWLGDRVGWWGDYLHTYGGDNELTSRIYELGYKVSPIPGTKIKDHETDDDLRKINNFGHSGDPKKTGGHHPDSWAWGKKWQFPNRRGDRGQVLTGPTIRHYPMLDNSIEKKHRVVYLPIYEQGWPIQKTQKCGLREALAKVALTVEYDYIQRHLDLGKEGMLAELTALMQRVQPTIFLSQLHNGAQINGDDIRRLRSQFGEAKFVNWNGDVWSDNLLSADGIKLASAFDLQLTVNRSALDEYKKRSIVAEYWQIGFEPLGVGCKSDLVCDVTFLASGYSPARQNLVKALRSLDVNFALYGNGWPNGWSKGANLYNFSEACKCYRAARISIGDSQWAETGFVSNRVFQALAAGGAALAHQWFRDMDKLGLIDGETCIVWRDFAELREKIGYYLKHESERERIATAGHRMCLERHSFERRVSELFEMLEPEKVVEESWRW